MSDVSRKVVPDEGSLNRERLVTKALNSVLHKKWSGESEKDCTQGGRAPSKRQNAKVSVLKTFFDWQPHKKARFELSASSKC